MLLLHLLFYHANADFRSALKSLTNTLNFIGLQSSDDSLEAAQVEEVVAPLTLWRSDGRCGPHHRTFCTGEGMADDASYNDGGGAQCEPAMCDPNGPTPCCSKSGWCGSSAAHCNGKRAYDFRSSSVSVCGTSPPFPLLPQGGTYVGWSARYKPSVPLAADVADLGQQPRNLTYAPSGIALDTKALHRELSAAAGLYVDKTQRPDLANVVAIVLANSGFWLPLQNLLCTADKFGIEIVVLALDSGLHDALAAGNPPHEFTASHCHAPRGERTAKTMYHRRRSVLLRAGVDSRPAKFGEGQYFTLVQQKLRAVVEVLTRGYDLLYVDADVAFARDPVPLLFGRTSDNALAQRIIAMRRSNAKQDATLSSSIVYPILPHLPSALRFSLQYQIDRRDCPYTPRLIPAVFGETPTEPQAMRWNAMRPAIAKHTLNSGVLVVRAEDATVALWRAAIARATPRDGDQPLIWTVLNAEAKAGRARYVASCTGDVSGVRASVTDAKEEEGEREVGGTAAAQKKSLLTFCPLDPFLVATGWRVGARGHNKWCSKVLWDQRVEFSGANASETDRAWPPLPVIVHANFLVGKQRKIDALAEFGWWCLPPKEERSS